MICRRLHTGTKLPILTACRLPRPLSLRSSSLLLSKCQFANSIHQCAPLPHTTRHTAIARRDIQARVSSEEVPRSQQQRHRLRGHDREVLGTGEVRDAECVPEDNVGVFEGLCGVRGDPSGDSLRGLAGGLGDVAAGGVDLVVVVCIVNKYQSGL